MEKYLVLATFVGSVIALLFALFTGKRVLRFEEGTPLMSKISRSIREGGTHATLRGIEFYNFGAFFSRAYRENDYLWGRLHGAERLIDIIASAM